MVKNLDEEVAAQLQELGLSLGGSGRARAERLYRAWLRTVGIPGVPTIDVAGEEQQTSHTELREEGTDFWPKNRFFFIVLNFFLALALPKNLFPMSKFSYNYLM